MWKSFFSLGFRPFFAANLILAIIITPIWIVQYSGLLATDFSPLTARQWHANEMIFGFLFSAIIGFLLTASSKWTGTRGLNGGPLAFFWLVFLFTRVVFFATPFENLVTYQIIGLLGPVFLIIYLAQLFILSKNFKNLVILVPLLVLCVSQYLLLTENYVTGYQLAINAVRLLVVIIAGRIIPFFTKSALGLEPRFDHFLIDKLLMFSVAVLIFEPLLGNSISTLLIFISAVLSSARLMSWRFFESTKSPILFALYLAYLWIPIHFLLSLSMKFEFYMFAISQSSLHAITYGCMGMMIMAMIHRVSLGHTGRVIRANGPCIFAYGMLFTGALVRVFFPIFLTENIILWMYLSTGLWVLSFLVVAVDLLPKLVSVRIDGKEY